MLKLPKFNWNWLEIVLIVLLGLIPLLWFKPGFMALGHDMSFPLDPISYFQDRLYTWTDRVGTFGSNQSDSINGFFIHGLEALVMNLGLSLVQTQKLVFIFWFLLPGITMYIFVRHIYPKSTDWVSRLSSTLVYMVNYYLLQGWIIAERTKFSIVSALPLFALFTSKALFHEQSLVTNSLVLALILFFLNGGAGIPLWGSVAILLLSIILAYLISSPKSLIKKIFRAVSFSSLLGIWILLFNLYWIVPYFQSFQSNYTQRVNSSGGVEGAVGWSRAISAYTSFFNLLRLQGIPDWYGNPEHPYANVIMNNTLFIGLSFAFPIIGISGLILIKTKKKDPNWNYYLLLGLTGLILAVPLSAGSHSPTGWFYELMLRYLPGFSIFRTPFYKFGMMIWFSFSILIGFGIKYISIRWNKPILWMAIFVLSWGLYHYPVFSGKFFDWSDKYSTMVKVPDYVFSFKKWIEANPFSTRTLILPPLDRRNNYEIYDWKYFSLSTLQSMLTRKPVVINDATLMSGESILVDKLYSQLHQYGDSPLVDYLGIDRILLRQDTSLVEDMEYSSAPILNNARANNRYTIDVTWDKWSGLLVSDLGKLRPKFNLSSNIDNLDIKLSDLSAVLDYYQPKSDSAFILSQDIDLSKNVNVNIGQTLTKIECRNCKSEPQFTVSVSQQKILPGSRLRWIVETWRKYLKSKLKNPGEIIDFDLGNAVKDAYGLNFLIKTKSELRPVDQILKKWIIDLHEIEREYILITDKETKQRYNFKIDSYLNYILVYAKDWESSVTKLQGKDSLDELVRLVVNIQNNVLVYDEDQMFDAKSNKFVFINIPTGEYRALIKTDTLQHLKTILLDGNEIKVEALSQPNWYSTPIINIVPGKHGIEVTSLPEDNFPNQALTKSIRLKLNSNNNYCEYISYANLSKDSDYKLSFEVKTLTKGVEIDIFPFEKNLKFSEGIVKTLSWKAVPILNDFYLWQTNYFPSPEAEKLDLRICKRNVESVDTEVLLQNISVIPDIKTPEVFIRRSNFKIYPNDPPKMKFVALNQTKYLVWIDKHDTSLLLDFDTRFDEQWKISRVQTNPTEKYFNGSTREYRNGSVTEITRQDNHFNSGITPAISKEQITVHIKTNSYGNGWIIDPSDEARTFLIEYSLQAQTYKFTIVSILFVISAFVYAIKIIVKNN